VEPAQQPSEPRRFLRGRTGLIAVLAVVIILLVWLPAYRWFFLISIGIGLIVACILHFWNKYRPVKEKDVENKRPLGLE
jgi:O-antigen/teichoic acid export membrane protein